MIEHTLLYRRSKTQLSFHLSVIKETTQYEQTISPSISLLDF